MLHPHLPTASAVRPNPGRSQSGFSLIEVLLGAVLLGLALLSHAASTVSEHRLARTQQVQSEVLHVVRQFMDRLRADEDWPTLYQRLVAVRTAPAGPYDLALEDGRVLRPSQTYYPGVTRPERLSTLRVHVDVPSSAGAGGLGLAGASLLREDALLPRFALPADLDGDGVVGPTPLNDTYNALPVIVTFHWTATGEAPEEWQVRTWLRGER